jgi:histidinol-phosphate phosphatase family protein
VQFVIIAGGLGTRSNLSIPKILNQIGGKSLLNRILDELANVPKEFESNVLFLLGHGSEQIESHLKQIEEKYDFTVTVFKEQNRLGTAGALFQSIDHLEEECVVILGDLFLDFDFASFLNFTKNRNSDLSLVCHPNGHPNDSDLVELRAEDSKLERIDLKKNRSSAPKSAIASAGIYYLRNFKRHLPNLQFRKEALDILDDLVIPNLEKFNHPIGYTTVEYIKDAGTPDRVSQIQCDVTSGAVSRRSRKSIKPAIFIDKDDTLVSDRESVISNLALRAGQEINLVNNSGIPIILITNQPSVAKGHSSLQDIQNELSLLNSRLGNDHAYLDSWYWCPHHPEIGYQGEIRIFKVKCNCRKPDVGLFKYAEQDHGLDLSNSWMIGDRETDFIAAKVLGMNFAHTIEFTQICSIDSEHHCFPRTSDAIAEARNRLC